MITVGQPIRLSFVYSPATMLISAQTLPPRPDWCAQFTTQGKLPGSGLRNRCFRGVLTPVRAFASVKEWSASPLQQRRPCEPRPRENPLPNAIITLTTDYGTNDHLVGTLKGVILKINPDATVVDITHNVAPFDLLDAALAIGSAYSYFPPRTIHVVVVDPGVGTERRPLLVTAENQYFVAPDNGVLSVIYEREQNVVARNVTASHYFLQPVSKTFHGRDIFAPIAAWLSKGWQTASMGDEITDHKKFALPKPKTTDGVVKGIVMRVDAFGNLVTNFRVEDLPESALTKGEVKFQVGNQAVSRMVPTFASGDAGEPVAYLGSAGYVEIAVNKGNASRTLSIGRGTAVVLTE
jgi:S-adenosyl-L-methionine hydrolase (adenosine-forming)